MYIAHCVIKASSTLDSSFGHFRVISNLFLSRKTTREVIENLAIYMGLISGLYYSVLNV